MEQEKKLAEPKIVIDLTTYDERRKVLIHKGREERETKDGFLNIESEAILHEEGIKSTLVTLESRKKSIIENINEFEEVLAEVPEMTEQLITLKEHLKTLQLIDFIEKMPEKDKAQKVQDLKNLKSDLKKIDKDIKEIKSAVGTKLKL